MSKVLATLALVAFCAAASASADAGAEMQAAAMKCATEYSNTQTCGPAGKCEMQDVVVEGSTETASMCTMSKAEQQRLTAQALDEAVKAAKPAAFNGSVSFYRESTNCTGAATSTAGAVDVTGTCKLDEGTWDKHISSTGNTCTNDTTVYVFSGFSTEALCNDTMALPDKATLALKADGECNQITDDDGSTFSYTLACGSAKPANATEPATNTAAKTTAVTATVTVPAANATAAAGGAKDPAANTTKPATNTAAKTTAATATVTIPADGNLATMSAADIAVLVTQFEATVKAACAADAAAAACTDATKQLADAKEAQAKIAAGGSNGASTVAAGFAAVAAVTVAQLC